MTARNKNDLRSLIEEARELATEALSRELLPSRRLELIGAMQDKFAEALALLPDADESASNWQEFDSEKDATWPQKDGDYLIQLRDGNDARVDYWESKISGWLECFDEDVLAYQPLPSPYVKP